MKDLLCVCCYIIYALKCGVPDSVEAHKQKMLMRSLNALCRELFPPFSLFGLSVSHANVRLRYHYTGLNSCVLFLIELCLITAVWRFAWIVYVLLTVLLQSRLRSWRRRCDPINYGEDIDFGVTVPSRWRSIFCWCRIVALRQFFISNYLVSYISCTAVSVLLSKFKSTYCWTSRMLGYYGMVICSMFQWFSVQSLILSLRLGRLYNS